MISLNGQVTHSLTVVFFSRTYLGGNKGIRKQSSGDSEGMHNSSGNNGTTQHANVDACGRLYEVRTPVWLPLSNHMSLT